MFRRQRLSTLLVAAATTAGCTLERDQALEVAGSGETSGETAPSPGRTPEEAPQESRAPAQADGRRPARFHGRGRVICLAEEMKRRYQADVQPVHDHLWGFRVDGESTLHPGSYLTLLYTKQSRALFVDKRFRQHELILTGRVFPRSRLLEVSGWQWIRAGKRYEVYYWCEVCSIKGVNPSDCACCQSPVELREVEVSERKQNEQK